MERPTSNELMVGLSLTVATIGVIGLIGSVVFLPQNQEVLIGMGISAIPTAVGTLATFIFAGESLRRN